MKRALRFLSGVVWKALTQVLLTNSECVDPADLCVWKSGGGCKVPSKMYSEVQDDLPPYVFML